MSSIVETVFGDWSPLLATVGALFLVKLLASLLLDLRDGCRTYLLPRLLPSTSSFPERFGRWAVVTGCTGGIGRSYVDQLAGRGMNIVLVSRSKTRLDMAAAEVKISRPIWWLF